MATKMQASLKAIISCLQTKLTDPISGTRSGSQMVWYRYQRVDALELPIVFFKKTGGTVWWASSSLKRGTVEGELVVWGRDTKEADDIANEIIDDMDTQATNLEKATYNTTAVENVKVGSAEDRGYLSTQDCYVNAVPISFEWEG